MSSWALRSRRLVIALIPALLAHASCNRFNLPTGAIDPAAFWSIIAHAEGLGGEIAHGQRLAETLHRLSPEQVIDFQVHYVDFHRRADQGDVWAAGVLLNAGHGSDDGFEYFRNWLIGQGQAVYEAALSHPDSLAGVEVEMLDGRPHAEWESHRSIAVEVFEIKTRANLYEVAAARFPRSNPWAEPSFDWSAYTNEVLQQKLPRLWSRYGAFKMEFDRRVGRHP
jgi:hypothetical protein